MRRPGARRFYAPLSLVTDRVPDVADGLEALVRLGVRRVVTSGSALSAVTGLDTLRRLVNRGAGSSEVIAPGNIRPLDVDRIVGATGAPAAHARWIARRQALDSR